MRILKREGPGMLTEKNKTEFSVENLHAKCEGIGCAYKESCNRYLTRNDGFNEFYSFYALADEDCKYFTSALADRYKPYKHMLCNDCLRVRDFIQDAHNGELACECGGFNMCGCEGCIETANALNNGFLKKEKTGLINDITVWNAESGDLSE